MIKNITCSAILKHTKKHINKTHFTMFELNKQTIKYYLDLYSYSNPCYTNIHENIYKIFNIEKIDEQDVFIPDV